MEHIVTYMGECFTPLNPDINQIRIEDIAHSLSLLCRANGHIDRFFSIAQHSINCAGEAKARNYSARVQLACLVHDGSEAYISDITRPVKLYLKQYRQIERYLQDMIYVRFLGSDLTDEESAAVDSIDNDMLICEFDKLARNKYLIGSYKYPVPALCSSPSFETIAFGDAETDFLKTYYGILHAGMVQGR